MLFKIWISVVVCVQMVLAEVVLVTGGTGYIGSHVVLMLVEEGYDVVVVDDHRNSNPRSLEKVFELTGVVVPLYSEDITRKEGLLRVFERHSIESVIHLAGLKSVGESESKPLEYYYNNFQGSLNLLEVMREKNVTDLVFSSSATVYGKAEKVPITEDSPLQPTNVYGKTKAMVEEMIRDYGKSDPRFRAISLRYFNPVGAHPSGEIGEQPQGTPANLMPYVAKVAGGEYSHVRVYGNDYKTFDGTGVRDYIHIEDLAEGHLFALRALKNMTGTKEYNLGTGRGYSVMEMIEEMSKVSGRVIPYVVESRRPGDVAVSVADPSLAEKELGWKAKRDLNKMCEDLWRWTIKHPLGYLE